MSSSISPIISEPKLLKTLKRHTTAFLLTYDDLCYKFLAIAFERGSITPLCMILEISLSVLPRRYSLWHIKSFLNELQAKNIYYLRVLSLGPLHFSITYQYRSIIFLSYGDLC
jgi:hypothetical protein